MEEHGEITLQWIEDILIVKAEGPFNEEGTLAAMKKYQQCILDSGRTSWLRLELWDNEALGTPQAMDHLPSIYTWSVQHGCVATAVVVVSSIQESIARKIAPEPLGVFREQDQAMAWLKQYL